MNTLKFIKCWFCYAWMPLYIGVGGPQNSSTSQSDQAQTTTNDTQDNRIAAGQASANTNNSRGTVGGNLINTVTNNVLDGGAISKSFDFAAAIAAGAAKLQAASEGNMKATVISSLDAVQSAYSNSAANVSAAYKDENANLASAYTNSKAGEQKVMVFGALLIGGIVALKSLGKAA